MGLGPINPLSLLISIGGSLLSSALSNKGDKQESKPTPVAKPPQEAKAPNAQAIRKENMGAAQAGPASTLLTGPEGVPNSDLNLGRNNLLGL